MHNVMSYYGTILGNAVVCIIGCECIFDANVLAYIHSLCG